MVFTNNHTLGGHTHLLQVEADQKIAKERIDLAKALIRASEKPAKAKKEKGPKETPNSGDTPEATASPGDDKAGSPA